MNPLLANIDMTSADTMMRSVAKVPREQRLALNDQLLAMRAEYEAPFEGLLKLYHGAPGPIAQKIKANGFELTQGKRSMGSFGAIRHVQNQGVFLTDSQPLAQYFGQNRSENGYDQIVLTCYVDGSKIMDVTKMPPALKRMGRDIINAYYEAQHKTVPVGQWWLVFDSVEFIQACKDAGFTGVKFKEDRAVRKAAGSEGLTYMIFDPASIKQKGGVTIQDFYEKLVSENA